MRFAFAALCAVVLAVAAFLFGCQGVGGGFGQVSNLTLSSPAFQEGGMLPEKYTCDGSNVNPPLQISNIPNGTQSLALVVDDPDAPMGTWIHWIMWNIPPNTTGISERSVPPGAQQGSNTFGKVHWDGPCSAAGTTHRYLFRLYALDKVLNLPEKSAKPRLEAEMQGHVLGQTQLTVKYARPLS